MSEWVLVKWGEIRWSVLITRGENLDLWMAYNQVLLPATTSCTKEGIERVSAPLGLFKQRKGKYVPFVYSSFVPLAFSLRI